MSILRLNPLMCFGCSACKEICGQNAIQMRNDAEGFLRPVVETDKCTECGLCEKVCPAMKERRTTADATQPIFAAYSKESAVVDKSTSGGIFYHLAEAIIHRKGVVYGAVYNKDFHVCHTCATDMNGIKAMHGAKYVQSAIPEGIFRDIRSRLQKGQWVLFSGTPCQVDALKSFLRKDYDHLLLCDLVCRSVSSPVIYSNYLKFAQQKKKLKTINMRWKGNGWDHTKFHLAYTDNSEETGKGMAQLWHDIHFSGLVTRPCCHHCPYTNLNRPGDITLGDFWGIRKSHPDFFHPQGVSLVMTNTPKGVTLFDAISSSVNKLPSGVKECLQPALRTPVKAHSNRSEFWREYPNTPFVKLAKKYFRYGWLNQTTYLLRRRISSLLRNSSSVF